MSGYRYRCVCLKRSGAEKHVTRRVLLTYESSFCFMVMIDVITRDTNEKVTGNAPPSISFGVGHCWGLRS